jgi:hypothetical protein
MIASKSGNTRTDGYCDILRTAGKEAMPMR